jgi:hypothetical protein
MHAILWMAAALPVVVGQLSTGPHAHMTVTNTASQPVTGWAFAVVTHPEPGRTHREVETIDGYLSEATRGIQGSAERLERLMPQQSRDIQLDVLPQDATVEVVAVILDDGTAMGDEAVIAPMFARRVKERDALGAVVAVFNDVLSSQHGPAALDALKERLLALPSRDEVPCRAAIEAVETYRQRGGARTADQLDESLRMYAAFVTREHELAKKHSQRRH